MPASPAILEHLEPDAASDAAGRVPPSRGSVVVIGNFDGVHRGHQAVLAEAVALAERRALVPLVLTFAPHPAAVLGRTPPPLLTTLPHRAELLAGLGLRRVVALRFDLGFAAWSPERFARELLRDTLGARVVVVGENFRFGARRAGDFAELARLGFRFGFEACGHAMAADGRGAFSSTRAREAIGAGDLAEARAVLGRSHALSGVVAHGEARGRTLGFPTANLEGIAEMVPPHGVYAVRVDALDGPRPERLAGGVMNIGVRPTVSGEGRATHEAHLFDFEGDLYGRALRVHLVARLREERRFDGVDALRAQIRKDSEAARAALALEAQSPTADPE